MSVQNEIYLQELVAEYNTMLSMIINFNGLVDNLKAKAEYIKTLPLYDTDMTIEEKEYIETVITTTTGLHL